MRGGDERLERARLLYERAVFGGEASVLPVAERELDHVEADLALARGRILHARFLEDRTEDARELGLFERATQLRPRTWCAIGPLTRVASWCEAATA